MSIFETLRGLVSSIPFIGEGLTEAIDSAESTVQESTDTAISTAESGVEQAQSDYLG